MPPRNPNHVTRVSVRESVIRGRFSIARAQRVTEVTSAASAGNHNQEQQHLSSTSWLLSTELVLAESGVELIDGAG
jgi:hypothetical protein